jgi:hypothetical protein
MTLLQYIKGSRFSLLLFICIVIFINKVAAQDQTNGFTNLQHKLNLYRQTHPSSDLFVHFDKTLYTNNDNVWFTAYLLNCGNLQLHHTLSACLVNDIDRSIALEEKFIMANGLGFGNLHLSDTIAPGNYTFIVYTNRMLNKKPETIFTQHITIKTTVSAAFKAMLSLTDTSHALYNKPRQVILNVNGNDFLPVANATVAYRISGKDTTAIEGKAKTDKAGQYMLQLPPGSNMLKVQVKDKKNSQYVFMPLPGEVGQKVVKFYPEGGNLIKNLPAHVGWEVTSTNGQPLRVQGILFENNIPIDTIETNSSGIGRFVMVPQFNKTYTVKLAGYTGTNNLTYKLPAIIPGGLSMAINKSLVNDTLNVVIRSTQNETAYINVHNFQQIFASVPVQLIAFQPRKVKIALHDLPKGLAEVTLTDSLERPYAERIFFAHYNQRDRLTITTNKNTYAHREKVHLKLKINSTDGNKVRAAVSVACVQDNRLELKKVSNIESYLYIKSVLESCPIKESILGDNNSDKMYLENLLLIKGWRKYAWTDMLATANAGPLVDTTSATFSGKVSVNGKVPKKPLSFFIQRDSSAQIMETDATGSFALTYDQLICEQDKKIKFIADPQKLYDFTISNPYNSINKTLAKQLKTVSFELPLSNSNSDYFAVKGLERAIQLRAVTVKASNDRLLYSAKGNACGDYVCLYNILNCPNHYNDSFNKPPIEGRRYRFNNVYIFYKGCGDADIQSMASINGIYQAKQFYGSDYAIVNPSQPEYVSTLYWNHLAVLDSDKETEMSFYTGDITGKFSIVVQGITSNGVTYSESSITVKKP